MDDNPIGIERVFNLGDYKSLRVRVNSDDVEDIYSIAVRQVADAYITLFVHNLFTAHLENNEQQIDFWEDSIEQTKNIRTSLLEVK